MIKKRKTPIMNKPEALKVYSFKPSTAKVKMLSAYYIL